MNWLLLFVASFVVAMLFVVLVLMLLFAYLWLTDDAPDVKR